MLFVAGLWGVSCCRLRREERLKLVQPEYKTITCRYTASRMGLDFGPLHYDILQKIGL